MTFKVAVVSTDKEKVNEHFGKAKEFLIYVINDDGTYEFIEARENIPPCSKGDHAADIMNNAVNLIQDVKVLLVSNVGPGAINVLIDKKIKPYVTSYTIDKALKELYIAEKDLH
ncbi:MAG: NifB/NifX family molybdenum-iron cluster-binding protein [Methanobrevibacter sp.]|nr:NifB/NifX family molybdenum-iron cluster-binding protein [Methanobrevibacter sp.]